MNSSKKFVIVLAFLCIVPTQGFLFEFLFTGYRLYTTNKDVKEFVDTNVEKIVDGTKKLVSDIASYIFKLISDHIECNCDIGRGTATCKCCLLFSISSSKYAACLEGGIAKDPSRLFLSAYINDDSGHEFPLLDIERIPELCLPIPFTQGLVDICASIYNHDFCFEGDDYSFKLCFQADIVIGHPVFTVDFNCIAYYSGKWDIDSSLRTDRPGIITYKLGRGFGLGIFRSSSVTNATIYEVGLLDEVVNQRKLAVKGRKGDSQNQKKEKKRDCVRLSKYMQKCTE